MSLQRKRKLRNSQVETVPNVCAKPCVNRNGNNALIIAKAVRLLVRHISKEHISDFLRISASCHDIYHLCAAMAISSSL
jgi:hypothetical protein